MEGSPQAAPLLETGRGNASSTSNYAGPTVTLQAEQSDRNVEATSGLSGPNDHSTILLVTPSGQPLTQRTERFEWIPDPPNTDALADDSDWSLPEPTLRNLRSLTKPSQVDTPPRASRLPSWFAERTGMIALNAKAELPVTEVVDAENVDVVLGAMIGVNRVITVASSVITEPLEGPVKRNY